MNCPCRAADVPPNLQKIPPFVPPRTTGFRHTSAHVCAPVKATFQREKEKSRTFWELCGLICGARDWNRIKLDTFVPVLVGEQPSTPKKSGKKAAAESVEPASNDDKVPGEKKAKPVKVTAAKEAAQKSKPTTATKAPKPAAVADGGVQQPDATSAQPDTTAEALATEGAAGITPQE